MAHKNIEEVNKNNSVRNIFTSVKIERLFQKSADESNVIGKEDTPSTSKSYNGHQIEQDICGHICPKFKGIAKIQSFQCLSRVNDKLRPIYCLFTIKNASTSSEDQPPQQYQSLRSDTCTAFETTVTSKLSTMCRYQIGQIQDSTTNQS